MAPSALRQQAQRFTWQDYQTWPEGERWEIMAGEAWAMAPAPSISHQSAVLRLGSRLAQALEGRPCKPFISPVDVRLSDEDVVQPDLLVVCDRSRILPSHIEGAPDVVVEVLSPATAVRDQREKKALYERSGVKEYVLLHPTDHIATRFLLDTATGRFDSGNLYAATESLVFATLDDLAIPLWEVFEVPGPGEVAEPLPPPYR